MTCALSSHVKKAKRKRLSKVHLYIDVWSNSIEANNDVLVRHLESHEVAHNARADLGKGHIIDSVS